MSDYLLKFIEIYLTITVLAFILAGGLWLLSLPFKGRRGGAYREFDRH